MLDAEILKRELHATCRQRGKNVEFVQDGPGAEFTMIVTPSLGKPVFVSEDELAEESDMNGFIEILLAEAGII